MDLIVTHIGADFDAFASVLAAGRLHEGARVFFPGSKEESVRRMLESGFAEVEELRQREIDPEAVERVILVDIRQPDRIGVVAEWFAARPDLPRVIYDHHTAADGDLEADGGIIDPSVGATATLLAEEMGRRGLPVSPREATILLMGIYEDTGSLTYPTVSPRDLAAVAWLLERGGDLAAVRRFALRHLDARRLEILHRMTRSLEVRRIQGHRVGIVALELGTYVDELAPLVSRCLEIFELPLLFGLFGEEDRVVAIARGEAEGVDLGEILATTGAGGGHATAASASLRGVTVLEARERLVSLLEAELPTAARVREIMTETFHRLQSSATVVEAKEFLNRRRVNALPVVSGEGRIVGAVTRQLLDSALQHELGGRPVETIMETDLVWVSPDAPADEIGDRMMELHPRFLLVGSAHDGVALGIVTRMQALAHLHGRLLESGEKIDRRTREARRQRVPAGHLLRRGLSETMRERLETVARVARELGVPVYLVGGLVRDLLLERANRDVDLVVEGDGPHFARRLAEALGGRVRVHEAFMTAVVIAQDGFRVDIATARSEFYRTPAALPEVQTSALRQDLYRRDFTINTLAIGLGDKGEPVLLDYFGGRRDLRRGTIRVLHSLSFIDDPTRMLRAVRLEQRLGFHISGETERLMKVALEEGAMTSLSPSRLRDELKLLLGEPATVERSLDRLEELGLLTTIHPDLRIGTVLRDRLRRTVATWDWYRIEGLETETVVVWRLLLLALAADLPSGEVASLADRLALAGEDRSTLTGFRPRVRAARQLAEDPRRDPHELAETLGRLAEDEILLTLAVADDPGRERVRIYLTEHRALRLGVRGADLVARGHEPGPALGDALAATLRARLDGRIGPDEELDFALAALAGAGGPASPVAASDPGDEGES